MMGSMKGLWGQGTGFLFLKSSNGIFVCCESYQTVEENS